MQALYGLIGYPLTHSFSPAYFGEKFRAEGIAAAYRSFPLPDIRDLPALFDAHPGLLGLNVTIPYKTAVLPFLHTLSPDAAQIGAVNCIRAERSSGEIRLHGHNTDWSGFLSTLPDALLQDRPAALLLGSGGASLAVQFALEKAGIPFKIISRREGENNIPWESVTEQMVFDHPLIINTTPLGMYPDTDACPPLPYEALTADHLLYDLIYNPEETQFMQEGRRRGAKAVNGYAMLVAQAEESWRIWNQPIS